MDKYDKYLLTLAAFVGFSLSFIISWYNDNLLESVLFDASVSAVAGVFAMKVALSIFYSGLKDLGKQNEDKKDIN